MHAEHGKENTSTIHERNARLLVEEELGVYQDTYYCVEEDYCIEQDGMHLMHAILALVMTSSWRHDGFVVVPCACQGTSLVP